MASPYSTLVIDASGNLYGTTTAGGAQGYGTVFELTIGPLVFLDPTSLNFGDVQVGHMETRMTTLTNVGHATLHITNISIENINGDAFSQTNNCPSSLGAGDSCTISVTFDPPVEGGYEGILFVSDDAPGSPQKVRLSGTGIVGCHRTCSEGCDNGCHCHDDRCVLDDPLNELLLDRNPAASSSCNAGESFSPSPTR